MYLSRFGVKNYKCLGEIDIPLTPIHVLIGENDAGKTSLLEAMAAFCASSEKPLSELFPEPWEGRELVSHGVRSLLIQFTGVWTPSGDGESASGDSPLQYEFEIDFTNDDKSTRVRDGEVSVQGIRGELSPLVLFLSATPSREEEILEDAREAIAELLKPAHKYAFNAKQMAIPAAFDPARTFRMDPDGFGLATLLDDILGLDPEIFLRIRKEFCEFFPQFENLQVKTEYAIRRDRGRSGLDTSTAASGKGIHLQMHSGQRVRAQHASDGAILFLGFLALAHLPDPPNLLLIEEPENGVYPKRLAQVIKLLKELVNRTDGVRFPQIIMSTHSPYVLSFFEPEEVTYLSRPSDKPDAPVRARPLRDAPNINERLSDGFYLGELWYNLSEEDLFGGS